MEPVHAVSIEALLGRRPGGREAEAAPGIVWWEGPVGPVVPRPLVAVIGSPEAPPAVAAASWAARSLVMRGAAVAGCTFRPLDRVALHVAMATRELSAVGISPSPVQDLAGDDPFLKMALRENGLLLSPSPPLDGRVDVAAADSLLALLADAVIVVNSTGRDGAPAAARTALKLGRPVWIWRDAFEDPDADWARALEGEGARRLDVRGVDHLIAELGRRRGIP
jgi:predicted Rossmann fold nucleotide-binding protein DprA/Smf involved in DNA uptake